MPLKSLHFINGGQSYSLKNLIRTEYFLWPPQESLSPAALMLPAAELFFFFFSPNGKTLLLSLGLFILHILFAPLCPSQCSRTQCAKSTGSRRWTASGCLCESKWRSARCRSAFPSSCCRCTSRRTWAGEWLWNRASDLLHVIAASPVASERRRFLILQAQQPGKGTSEKTLHRVWTRFSRCSAAM